MGARERAYGSSALRCGAMRLRCDRGRPQAELAQNVFVVLAERGRRGVDAGTAMGEGEGGNGHAESALDSVGGGVAMDDSAGGELRVGKCLPHGPNARRRDMAGL